MTDHADHLSLDTLAELAEGLLDDTEAGAADRHLAGCAECRARQIALRGVPALLAAAADTGPLPVELAARLEAALEAESAPEPAIAAPTPLPDRPRTGWGIRLLQAAAAVVLLLAGTGVVVSSLDVGPGRQDDRQTTTEGGGAAAPGAASVAAYPVTESGRNWDRDTLLAAAPALVRGELGPSARTAAPGDPAPLSSAEAGQPKDSALRLAGGEALATCVGRLALGPATPLSVDIASWEGSPAAVIVLPSPDAPAEADIYVVAPDCPEGSFLFYAHVQRP